MIRWYVWHDSFICVTWPINARDMTHSYVWNASFICVTWFVHNATRLINMWGMTQWYAWHDSFIRVTWLIHTRDMTHSYAWRDSFIRVTWLIQMCDMTHSYVWHEPFLPVTCLIHICDITYWCLRHESLMCVTRISDIWWLRLVGSLKLQVSFAKEPYKKDATLQKRPIILRSLLIVATPYVWHDPLKCVAHFVYFIRLNYRSLLQKSPIKKTLFCKRDL